MCGRFVLKASVAEIKEWFGTASALPEAGPRYNVESRLPISFHALPLGQICPSTGPVLQDSDKAACTAARSRLSPPTNPG